MISFLIAILVIFAFQYALFSKKYSKTTLKYHLGFAGIVLIIFIPLAFGIKRLLWLNELNQLYVGQDTLLGTLDTLINESFYYSDKLLNTTCLMKKSE